MRRLAYGRRAAQFRGGPGLAVVVFCVLASATTASAQPESLPAQSSFPAPEFAEVYDPFGPYNRQIHDLNMGLDRAFFAPVTHVYVRGVPGVVRRRIGSALDNLREPRVALNDLAQGHVGRAATAASRFVVNSTVGVLGLFDVASGAGLPPHNADFGQTLGRYGLEPGPYLVLPVFGPHNVRETVGRMVDALVDPVNVFLIGGWTTEGGATRLVAAGLDYRAEVDPAMEALEDATDSYVTMRSAYGQRRAAVVREATGEAEELPDFDAESPQQ